MSDEQQQQQPPTAAAAAAAATGDAAAEAEPKMTKSAEKKARKLEEARKRREEVEARKAAEAAESEARRRAEAASVHIALDDALPPATAVHVRDVLKYVGQRVKLSGWVHHVRRQGKGLMFIELRDGTHFQAPSNPVDSSSPVVAQPVVQCVLRKELAMTLDALELYREASVHVYGTLTLDQRVNFGGIELAADYWEVVGKSSVDLELRLNQDAHPDVMMHNRHIVLRGTRTSSILKMRSTVLKAFRDHFYDRGYSEVTTPTIVQTQCEGGSTLFNLQYFTEPAYMTQSSQLYLESTLPGMGSVYCIMPSYRAEKSRTRRHLSEYTHLEGEIPFITFEDLLQALEDLICDTVERVFKLDEPLLRLINPKCDECRLKRPFKRMTHREAIQYCRDHEIYKDEAQQIHFDFEDDIPEGPERKMTDMIGEPIFLTHFPVTLKSFYAPKAAHDQTITETVDLLIPSVGEIIGGSMRTWNPQELDDGYRRAGINPTDYYWYTEQRQFGTVPHGGYGLGVERFLCWLLQIDHVREVCLYPRYIGRCTP